jgi:hypothetical protein
MPIETRIEAAIRSPSPAPPVEGGGMSLPSPLAGEGRVREWKELALDRHFPCLGPWKILAIYISHGRVGGVGPPVRSMDERLIALTRN